MTDSLSRQDDAPGALSVVLLPMPSAFEARVPYYRAADVCWASSSSQAIDTSAREFLASRDDEQGVLAVGRLLDEATATCPGLRRSRELTRLCSAEWARS